MFLCGLLKGGCFGFCHNGALGEAYVHWSKRGPPAVHCLSHLAVTDTCNTPKVDPEPDSEHCEAKGGSVSPSERGASTQRHREFPGGDVPEALRARVSREPGPSLQRVSPAFTVTSLPSTASTTQATGPAPPPSVPSTHLGLRGVIGWDRSATEGSPSISSRRRMGTTPPWSCCFYSPHSLQPPALIPWTPAPRPQLTLGPYPSPQTLIPRPLRVYETTSPHRESTRLSMSRPGPFPTVNTDFLRILSGFTTSNP